MIERIDPEPQSDERTMLVEFLEWYRATLLVKAAGLTDEQARTASVEPSILSITGLVRHMAAVERIWFQIRFRGDDVPRLYWTDDDPDGDMRVDEVTLSDALTVWEREVALSREVLDGAQLEDVMRTPVLIDGEPEWRASMRWILIHMIEEYARHAGHLDFLRERIDGITGD
jgi:uncharacterized damage-inducible protein DinB